MIRLLLCSLALLSLQAEVALAQEGPATNDHLRELQTEAIQTNKSPVAHWGFDPQQYVTWSAHSNRLIPVYAFGTREEGEGVDLSSYTGVNSPYRSADELRRIYGYLPDKTVSSDAQYMDQTNIYDLQKAAVAAGKKYIFLVVFDGMDWQTAQAAAIYSTGGVEYDEGRGSGLHFQDYQAGGTTQFGYMVTSPHNDKTKVNVDEQRVLNPGGTVLGGYDPQRGGFTPWEAAKEVLYPLALPEGAEDRHAYTDSSSSATSMTAGIKTFNNGVNVDYTGKRVKTLAHQLQVQGYSVGVVTSVPISHATPASAYAHNVERDDYQDLTRDMLGLPSVSHPEEPLPGLDVVIGTGFGVSKQNHDAQGVNFIPGNQYLADIDLRQVDTRAGGEYVVAIRTPGASGKESLQQAADEAASSGKRLLGFYGTGGNHGSFSGSLPLRTADGGFDPAPGLRGQIGPYSQADLHENPTLADMTDAALTVVGSDPQGFWLMVEAGDVDWANHDNNLDASIGAVLSGDDAVRVITEWVEANSNWSDSLMIVTADHGHYLFLDQPEALAK